MSYQLVYTGQAQKDARKLKGSHLAEKARRLLETLKADPFKVPPPYKTLVGDLSGAFSRRINRQHRLVYQVLVEEKIVKILRMWGHYE